MNRYATRFRFMNPAQKKRVQDIEQTYSVWRRKLVLTVYALTPRWLFLLIAGVVVFSAVMGRVSDVYLPILGASVGFLFLILGGESLIKGWSFHSRGRYLLTGVLHYLVNSSLMVFGFWMMWFSI